MSVLSAAKIRAMKVSELKEELKSRKLDVHGLKGDLVKRLLGEIENDNKEDKPAKKVKQNEPEDDCEDSSKESENSSKESSDDVLQSLKDSGWNEQLKDEFAKPYFKGILKFLAQEKANGKTIFPPQKDIFNAFNYTPFDSVRVVIIGQDPYFNEGQAHGLCFSVPKGVKVPPSLNTIYKELETCVPNFKNPKHGCLEEWAKRGVLLLNATLTVEKGKPNTHASCGWQKFTDTVIDILNEKKDGLVFLLWGGFAQKKGKKIDSNKHHVLQSPHPSPMAAGAFKGCGCFKEANKLLKEDGKEPIDWSISP